MKTLFFYILIFVISSTGCQQQFDQPVNITEKYWRALNNADDDTVRHLTSSTTIESLNHYRSLPDHEKASLKNLSFDKHHVSITTTVNSAEQKRTFETILVLENGEWKIDATRTFEAALPTPAHNNNQSDSLDKSLDDMDKSLKEGADMLNQFMQEGSREMSESLRKGVDQMNDALRDALDKMKQQRQQEHDPSNTDRGEGLI
ncbi:MAG: hypothetical protein OEZ15_00110 [Gammaproteobacteria bacterium]|nr:hypothetical protein [Gammaproteobacteria bacterium]